jgi:hypothetical protein
MDALRRDEDFQKLALVAVERWKLIAPVVEPAFFYRADIFARDDRGAFGIAKIPVNGRFLPFHAEYAHQYAAAEEKHQSQGGEGHYPAKRLDDWYETFST